MLTHLERMEKFKAEANNLNLELLEGEEIQPGDLYLAVRNGSVHLLECDKVNEWCILPKLRIAYPYYKHECIKIKQREE